MTNKPTLTIPDLLNQVSKFSAYLKQTSFSELYGKNDGKAVGTFVEHQLKQFLTETFSFAEGNSAQGLDFPELNVDLKVTSIKQPQSSCPFKTVSQKVYGLGYHLLVIVYDKVDDPDIQQAHLNVQHIVFVEKNKTGDYQLTKGLLELLKSEVLHEEIVAFLQDRNLPIDDLGLERLAKSILTTPPEQGYLTISNALQWRLQYGRLLKLTHLVEGIQHIV